MEGGKTIGYIYSGATPAGIFSLSDACRSGVQDAIRELKLLGIKTAMLTGDSHAAATHVQEQVQFLALIFNIILFVCMHLQMIRASSF
jgi:Cd2+/Zn2+-exporting ATPase